MGRDELNLSRRDFLKAVAAGTVVIGSAGCVNPATGILSSTFFARPSFSTGKPAELTTATTNPVAVITSTNRSDTVRPAIAPPDAALFIPPPSGGWFPFAADGEPPIPAGLFSTLPDDEAAAAMVHRSRWEPRPENIAANLTAPPVGYVIPGVQAYPARIWSRVTGRCPLREATTDELIQWAAAKWGLPDDLLRAVLVQESHWYQNHRDVNGIPIYGNGYGDYNATGAPPSSDYNQSLGGTHFDPRRPNGPESYGICQIKWWAWRPNPPGTGEGSYPWIETSTPYALDFYAAALRGQYEGWNQWMKGAYLSYQQGLAAGGMGDIWGCVGNWYSGDWHGATTVSYIASVRTFLASKPWLSW